MKCSKCEREATSLIATVLCSHDFEIMRYEARCNEHNKISDDSWERYTINNGEII